MDSKKARKPHKLVKLTSQIAFSKTSEKGRFTKVLKTLHLTPRQTWEILHFYASAEREGVNVEQWTIVFSQFNAELEKIRTNLDPAVQKKLKELQKLQAGLDEMGQFQTTLPLLSHILTNTLAVDMLKPFELMWIDLENDVWFNHTTRRGLDDRDVPVRNRAVRKVVGISMYLKPDGTYEFTCGSAICVDGAPDAYGPNNSGTDLTSSGGREGYWWGVVTDNGKSNGKPLIKEDGLYIATTAYVYSNQPDNVQKRYVNANIVPFSVLSDETMNAILQLNKSDNTVPVITMGDLIYVYNGKTNKGVWTALLEKRNADDRIGEVSLAAAKVLGIENVNPRTGGQDLDVHNDSNNISFIVYPNTSPIPLKGDNFSHFLNDKEAIDYIRRNGSNIDGNRTVDRNPRLPK